MPGLSAIYGLKWVDIEDMPWGELMQYVNQLDRWAHVLSSGAFNQKGGRSSGTLTG